MTLVDRSENQPSSIFAAERRRSWSAQFYVIHIMGDRCEKSWGCGGHPCIVISPAWVKNRLQNVFASKLTNSMRHRSNAIDQCRDILRPWVTSYHHGMCFHYSPYSTAPSGFVAPELWAPACSSVRLSLRRASYQYSHRYESTAFDKRIKPATEYSQTESVWAVEKDCYGSLTQSNVY